LFVVEIPESGMKISLTQLIGVSGAKSLLVKIPDDPGSAERVSSGTPVKLRFLDDEDFEAELCSNYRGGEAGGT
jgi:hypothetical protein